MKNLNVTLGDETHRRLVSLRGALRKTTLDDTVALCIDWFWNKKQELISEITSLEGRIGEINLG
jgi:hypothetical protein